MALQPTSFSPEISVGKCPNWITFSQDGRYAAVSNSGSDDSSIIDTQHAARSGSRESRQKPQASARSNGAIENHPLFLKQKRMPPCRAA